MPLPAPASGQVSDPATDPFLRVGMLTAPHLEMSTILEVTIFRIDVLSLHVRVPISQGRRLLELQGRDLPNPALGDSVATVIAGSDRLWSRQRLLRDVSLDRVVDGMLETIDHAVDAGHVSRTYRASLRSTLSDMFDFLSPDGGLRGDEILMEVRGDTLRTVYRARDGSIPLDRTTVSPDARAASVPSFFQPGTRFRQGLVDSIGDAQ